MNLPVFIITRPSHLAITRRNHGMIKMRTHSRSRYVPLGIRRRIASDVPPMADPGIQRTSPKRSGKRCLWKKEEVAPDPISFLSVHRVDFHKSSLSKVTSKSLYERSSGWAAPVFWPSLMAYRKGSLGPLFYCSVQTFWPDCPLG